jgi:hypothetical protein
MADEGPRRVLLAEEISSARLSTRFERVIWGHGTKSSGEKEPALSRVAVALHCTSPRSVVQGAGLWKLAPLRHPLGQKRGL